MKKIIAIIISSTLFCSILSSTLYAQYDEKFYFPIKGMERINDSINHEDIRIAVECNNPEVIHDTLYSVLIKPNKNNTAIKSTIIYFHGNSGNILDGAPSSFKDLVLLYTPKEYKEYVKDFPQPYSAKELIKNIQNIQILVVHSPEDKVIPQSMAEELYNNISPTCKKEYWKYSGEHLDAVRKYPLIFCGKIDNLLKATSK